MLNLFGSEYRLKKIIKPIEKIYKNKFSTLEKYTELLSDWVETEKNYSEEILDLSSKFEELAQSNSK